MAGYTRQSAGSIVTGAVILASGLNAEYNALEAAFSGSTGHNHTGGAGQGPIIAPAGGGTPVFIGGTATGTGNAVVISTTPSNYTLVDKYTVQWRPSAANTGPVTINVNGTGAIPIKNLNPGGYEDLNPGDLQPDQFSFLVYDSAANVYQSITTVFAFSPVVTGSGFIADFTSLFVRYVMTALSTVTLPPIADVPGYFWMEIQAQGGVVTLTPDGTEIIQGGAGGASYTIPQGTSALVYVGDDGKWYVNGTSNTQPVAAGGTGSTTASGARTNLGLVIGTNVQAYDATLAALSVFNSNGLMVQTASDTFTARSVAGTSNRITVTNGDGVSGNPTVDISSSYVGQNTITTLGTIGTGTWNATTIAVNRGGTGQTTANAAFNALAPSQTSNSGKFLTTDGTNTSWATVAAGFADPGANGIMVRTALNTSTARTITGTANEITVADGNGVSANPTLSLPSALTFTGKTVTGGTFTTPTINVNDNVFSIRDNGDTTKVLQFECSGISTATTRTLTVPNASGTIALSTTIVADRQTFTSNGTWNKPSGYNATAMVLLEAWGAGGGGADTAVAAGGAGGTTTIGTLLTARGGFGGLLGGDGGAGGGYNTASSGASKTNDTGFEGTGGGVASGNAVGGFFTGGGGGGTVTLGGHSVYGGGGGTGGGGGSAIGTSQFAGNGGAAGTAGTAPAGGGGGRGGGNGAGGGGGSYKYRWVTLADMGASESITIGTGGTAGSGSAGAGARGEVRITVFPG